MNWEHLWNNIIQPIMFSGLFLINVVIVIITIKNEMRIIEQNKQDILANAKKIKENYETLHKLLGDK